MINIKRKIVVFEKSKKLGETNIIEAGDVFELVEAANEQLVEILKSRYPDIEFDTVVLKGYGTSLSNGYADWYETNKYPDKALYTRAVDGAMDGGHWVDVDFPVELIDSKSGEVHTLNDIEFRFAQNDGYLLVCNWVQMLGVEDRYRPEQCFLGIATGLAKYGDCINAEASVDVALLLDKIQGIAPLKDFLRRRRLINMRFKLAYRKDGELTEEISEDATELKNQIEDIYCELDGLNPLDLTEREISYRVGNLSVGEYSLGNSTMLGDKFAQVPEDVIEAINELEKESGLKVYGVLHNMTSFGSIYTFLYVSKHQEDWVYERPNYQGSNRYLMAYAYNQTSPAFSEFGGVTLSMARGVLTRIF